jgi:ACS family pantothenate transporter-like MFS transporter
VYKVWQINVYPTSTNAVQVVTTLFYAWTSDGVFRGARWPAMIIAGVMNVIVYTSLAVWDISSTWKFACYVLIGFGGGLSGLWFAWCNEICGDDNEERAFVGGAMNEMAYVFQAWLPLLVWQQVDAPQYKKGFSSMIGISIVLMGTAMVTRTLHKRELKRYVFVLSVSL